ncbi:MAG: hypothetical protein AB1778_02110 [Candidatus Bipolaricaulota bacterium]
MGAVIVVTACFPQELRWIPRSAATRVVRTRMGRGAAEDLNRALGRTDDFALLISTGFCGGVDRRLGVGDMVIADAVRWEENVFNVDLTQVRRAHDALASAGLRAWIGPVACAPEVLDSEGKRAAALAGSLAVDMESGPLAAWAAERRVPFLSLRSVLDAAEDPMPFGRRPLALTAMHHPLVALRLAAAARRAGRRLGEAIRAVAPQCEGAV